MSVHLLGHAKCSGQGLCWVLPGSARTSRERSVGGRSDEVLTLKEKQKEEEEEGIQRVPCRYGLSGIGEASKTLQESSESDAKRRRQKIALERRERYKKARVSQIERDSTLVLCLKGGDCGFGLSQTPNGLRVPRPNSF